MLNKSLDNIGFLVGHKLLQVCVGSYDIILNFDGNVSISSQGHFAVDNGAPAELPHAAAELFPLLSAAITKAEMEPGGNARLEFSNAHALCLLNDSVEYEAYRIVAPGHDVTV